MKDLWKYNLSNFYWRFSIIYGTKQSETVHDVVYNACGWQVLIFLELPNQRVMAKLNISDYIVIELMKKDHL